MEDEYLDAFIRESEDEITKLNNSLLGLESDPGDHDAMEQIFRTAHTLKGNFGAMGFDDASDLAHAMEDLLDEMREGNLEVTPEVMDLVFAGVDQIEAIVNEIEVEGEPTVSTESTVASLREVLEEGSAGGTAATNGGGNATALEAGEAVIFGALDDEDLEGVSNVVYVTISVGETAMQGIEAMFILEAIEPVFRILHTWPDRSDIEDGNFDGDFGLLLQANDRSRVESELETIQKIERYTAEDVTAEVLGDPDAAGASAGEDDHAIDEIKSVRVDVDQLDDLHGMVEQLVTSRIKLSRAVEDENLDAAGETLTELDKITASLQNTVMDMRLIPLKKVVGKFPRMVRDLSRELDKEVDFEVEGEDIELDRTILTEISDPLMHIIRNAIDHGIEDPDTRAELGKHRAGSLTLRASRERDHVVIDVIDDGGGLDREDIKQTAIEHDLRSPEEIEEMPDSAIYDLVFHPGFSTAKEVTDTSGRGVGMDVVHDTVTRLDGSVSVESTPGEGTTVSLRLPVTMAIVKVLFVQVGEEEYGVPIKHVDEITGSGDVKRVNGQEVIKHNDRIYPIVDLADRFDVPGRAPATDGGSPEDGASPEDGGMVVRIRESERQIALRCDAVQAQEEVVVKPLEGILSGTAGLSGTAVLGDGNIVHILDVVTL